MSWPNHTNVGEKTVKALTRRCCVCGEGGELDLPPAGLHAWSDGAYVQDAFPNLPADLREQLVSGTHPACWDELYADL